MKIHSENFIKMTNKAYNYLLSLKKLEFNQIYLRISVKQGGCSGMSYVMKFEEKIKISDSDQVIDYKEFQIVCDNKSLLYLYGMLLDYTDDLIGGGFQFINPNAVQTCGCGKSFSV